jgi:hypothetical protein
MLIKQTLHKIFTKKNFLISFCLLILTFFLSNHLLIEKVFATEEEDKNFVINLHSTYKINANGKTLVTQKFTIRNLTPEYFINKYGIVVSSTNLENIRVTDSGNPLEPQVNKLTGQTSIGVTFEEQILGEGKTRELIISYLDEDIADISGKILEVNIPALADPAQYDQYQLDLIVPSIFGQSNRISPMDFTIKQAGDFDTFHYADLDGQAVSAIFGEQQVFDLKLSYYLNNPNSQNALTQITLPPETPKQKIHYHQLDPLPKNIKVDPDGNFIATYEIPANNSFEVQLLAQILLTLQADSNIPPTPVLPAHLSAQKFWETNNAELQEAASTLNSAQDINQFVIETLKYTQENLETKFYRLGAANSFLAENRQFATCQEFTDLFVTLARIKQIPAKRIVGYAYSSNEELRPISVVGDVLHAWPAFYNFENNIWQEIDPTWQSTTGGIDYFSKFDLNHITFAINGISSVLPYPAGSYLTENEAEKKKIYVEFSQNDFPIIEPEINIELKEQRIFDNFNFPGKYSLLISNPTGQVWYFSKFTFISDELIVNQEKNWPSFIAPFQEIEIPLTIYNKDSLIGSKSKLNINIQLKKGKSFNHEFEVKGFKKIVIENPERIIFLGAGLVVFILTTGSLFLLGRALTRTLRRKSQKFEEKDQELHSLSSALSENSTTSNKSQGNQNSSSKKRTSSTTD